MKKIALLALATLACLPYSSSAQYQEPQIATSVNKEQPRSTFMSFRNRNQAMSGVVDSSQNYANLNGKWAFMLFESEDKIPTNCFSTNFETSRWRQVSVPGSWEIQGAGEALFADKAYDFAKERPQAGVLPKDIPTAVYIRDFTVPFDYIDKTIFLHIGAAKAAITVYVNGKEVGYSQDSKNPAEFDISQYAVRGLNRLAIKVDRWSEGSFLEDQQMWRLSGINRDVYLFVQPKIRVRDYIVRTSLDPTYTNGLLETALLLKTQLLNPHTVTVHYDLYDPQGQLVNQTFRDVQVGMKSEDTVRFTASIPNVKQWNDETPHLYTLLYRVKREGRWTEFTAFKIGFRTIEIADDKLMINGKAIRVKGVNMAEHTVQNGNYTDPKFFEQTLLRIKQEGFNAVRTDGYPLPDSFYQICDRLGLYVWDVANINDQGMGNSLSRGRTLANNIQWREMFLDRVNNTYERGKNHPSIITWSLGDNAGNGYNMYQAYMMLRSKDDTRPIAYNGANLEWNTDIYCPSNPDMKDLLKIEAGRPIIPSCVEFSPEYWTNKKFQGAFINRWESASLNNSAIKKYAELNNDYKTVNRNNGTVNLPSLVDEAGNDTPTLAKVRKLFAAVVITPIDFNKGTFEFRNNLTFSNLDKIEVKYTITNGAKITKAGIINVFAAPGESVEVQIPGASSLGKEKKLTIEVGNLAKYIFN